jgi:DNA mismatch repair protein MSH5
VPTYVANDTFISSSKDSRSNSSISKGTAVSPTEDANDNPSMLIMTGPNYSGKSVYLKQIALIVFMAHIGRSVF